MGKIKKSLKKIPLLRSIVFKLRFEMKKENLNTNRLALLWRSLKNKSFFGIDINELRKLLRKLKFPKERSRFFYYIDERTVYSGEKLIVSNVPVDYSIILNHSLKELEKSNSGMSKILENLTERIVKVNPSENYSVFFKNMANSKCKSFEEALQRILFINQLLWQTGHTLVGLGRLDVVLNSYYENDLKSKKITNDDSRKMIDDFLVSLHKFYRFKSSALVGDTGQIIILGGKDKNNHYFTSALTYLFVEEITKLHLPDPKILLRVANSTPHDLLELAVKCMSTGIGSPLFANDEVIIPGLMKNGYGDDAFDYGTSACWEPLIPGKSTDQNNIVSFCLSDTINEYVIESVNSNLSFSNFDSFLSKLLASVDKELIKDISKVKDIKYAEDPLESLFMHNTLEKGTDLSIGDVKYNYFGILCPGFSNGINSLLNIERLVFASKRFSLKEFNTFRANNFVSFPQDINLKDTGPMFGEEDDNVVCLTNRIIKTISDFCDKNANAFGLHFKFGLSSPGYIMSSKKAKASFDGRKNGEPFGVHISSDKSIPYTELMNFASKLDYSGANIDGNVVDIISSPNIVKNNLDKFASFVLLSTKNGFFEFQMNILSSKELIDAKFHPEKHQNLIVRVWGFSSYFNDLPIEYKDLLIHRAEVNEGISR